MTVDADKQPARGSEEHPDATEPAGFIQKLSGFFKQPESFTLLGAIALFVGFLWFGPEIIEKFKTAKEVLKDFLAGAFEPHATGEIAPIAVVLAVIVFGALFTSTLYSIITVLATRSLRKNHDRSRRNELRLDLDLQQTRSERDQLKGALSAWETERDLLRASVSTERRQAQQAQLALEAVRGRLDAVVSETIRSVSRIRRQMFPAIAPGKGKTLRKVHVSYLISNDFSAEVRRRYTLRAGDTPLHMWGVSVSASSDAMPAANFADIEFQLLARNTGWEVVYLPAENDQLNKTACIFFLPALQPAEEREIEVVYRWPGLLLGLQKKDWEDIIHTFKSAGTIEEFQLEVFLQEGTGGQLLCSEVGAKLPHSDIQAATNDRGWRGWRYTGKNIPPELLSEDIAARLEWKRS